mmetsp:Transcript_9263/g.27830  ORF Transcript_9263/g.27830 Transcript_9263/m.27830 type:complete len:264 (-) Transcript_9263:2794-3585(-)|eukprot:CAMPEP_0206136840 /NCGR_PEP_ID=MMETSP1473-20131121/2059_1 /ASSEMBLY_ACC=CAM_ASM_001109 /TAXON_ID=1461547 /ORGANISM="Stichococcus sp, Strain RCC1054" /LENGTH=263 /DNA_ID=CAMNT_0053529641 /DNA_START=188 /DNA_END=979 /DNA_ORIENTATION=+
MASSLTSSLDLDNVDTKGTPVDLSTEPGRSGTTSAVGGASTGEANTKKSQDAIIDSTGIQPLAGGNAAKKPVTTPKTFKKSSDEDPLWQKLAVVGAIAVAGVALVAGAKKMRKEKEDEPKDLADSIKRKAKHAKHEAEKVAHKVTDSAGDAAEDVKEKAPHVKAPHLHVPHPHVPHPHVPERLAHAGEEAERKVAHAQQEARDKIKEETKKADKAAANPDAILEQKRMTYGQHSDGTPKKALKDTGDGFLNYKQWWPFAKKDL